MKLSFLEFIAKVSGCPLQPWQRVIIEQLEKVPADEHKRLLIVPPRSRMP